MDKYLYLRQISSCLFKWFDWDILYIEEGPHILGHWGNGEFMLTMSQLDTKLEELWQTKYKSEAEA